MSPAMPMFLEMRTNGQPPKAIAMKNVVGTTTTAYWDGIGPGGLTPSPTVSHTIHAMTSAATTFVASSTTPRPGCVCGANGGCVAITAVTTCGGTRQSITNATQPTNSGKSKSARKASDTAMTIAVATTPSSGCFIGHMIGVCRRRRKADLKVGLYRWITTDG